MKNHTFQITVIVFAAAVFALSCNKKASTAKQLDVVQAKTAEAAREIKDYAYIQKDEFVLYMQLQLADLNRDLDQLAARIDRSSEAVKAEAQPKVAALRAQIAVLNQQLAQAQNASESSWDSAKSDFKRSYDASKSGFQQARQWLSEKIAP